MSSNLSFVSDNGDTFALDGDLGVELVGMVGGLATTPVELIMDQNVNADGAVLLRRRRPPQRVIVEVMLREESGTRLQQWSRFQAAAYDGGKFVFDGSSGVRELRSLVFESSDRAMVNSLTDRFTASFVALDPWWYGPAQTESFTFGAPTPWNAAIAWNEPIPWNGGAGVQVMVGGDAPASPLWTITGAVTDLIVSNGAQSWNWVETLTTGNYGTVDHRPGSRSPRLGSVLNGVAESSFGLWYLLSGGSQLEWSLAPGDVDLIVSASGTDGSSKLDLWYEPRWLTPG